MRFSKALKKLRHGEAIARDEWSDEIYLKIDFDKGSELYRPVIYQCYLTRKERYSTEYSHWQWEPTQNDLLANDWYIFPIGEDIGQGDYYFNADAFTEIQKVMDNYIKNAFNDDIIRND